MMKDFEAIFNQHCELKDRYQSAKAANDTEAMDQIRAERNALDEAIEAKGADFARLYEMYESARERGNEHIDLCECYDYRDEAALIASFRKYGITAFTFSSGWSSAVKSAWAFLQNGCALAGMVEINSRCTRWDSDEYEKAPAYLFRVL